MSPALPPSMNKDQYHLLRAARSSGQDEHESAMVSAREEAAADPALLAQLEREKAMDLAMRAALQQSNPPPGFESSLLIAMRAAHSEAIPPESLHQSVLEAVRLPVTRSRPPDRSFSRRQWLGFGTAAAAAVTIASTWWWRSVAFSMYRLSRELAVISNQGVQLSLMSMDPVAISTWLDQAKAPRPGTLPDQLQKLPRKGCHLYQIDQHPVSLECFLLPGMRELHLFCTPAAGLLDPPREGDRPQLSTVRGLTLATWTKARQTILLLSHEPAGSIQSLLS